MTWLAAWQFIKANWKVAVSLAAALLIYVVIHGWMERECARREVQLRLQFERALRVEQDKNDQVEKKWRMRVYEVESAHQTRLQNLEAKYRDAVDRVGPVRVCPHTAGPATVSRDPPASSIDHGSVGDDGFSGGAGGRDIGPGLVRIARTADTQAAQLIACQQYIRSLEIAR